MRREWRDEGGGRLEERKGYMGGGSDRERGGEKRKCGEGGGGLWVQLSSAQRPTSPGGPAGPIGPSLVLY